MGEVVWTVVSVVVAIGAAAIVSGFVGRGIAKHTKEIKSTYIPTLDAEGVKRASTMDDGSWMPQGKDQIKYSARRATRKYNRDQRLEKEGVAKI